MTEADLTPGLNDKDVVIEDASEKEILDTAPLANSEPQPQTEPKAKIIDRIIDFSDPGRVKYKD